MDIWFMPAGALLARQLRRGLGGRPPCREGYYFGHRLPLTYVSAPANPFDTFYPPKGKALFAQPACLNGTVVTARNAVEREKRRE